MSQSEGASQSDPSEGDRLHDRNLNDPSLPACLRTILFARVRRGKHPVHPRTIAFIPNGDLRHFPTHLTTLDAYSFTPCGYSSNALLKWSKPPEDYRTLTPAGEGYYTIHVTPESGWSYASFECNVPLPTFPTHEASSIPDLQTLVRRVVRIFQPAKLSLTLFISSVGNSSAEEEEGISAVEAAQRAFRLALTSPSKANGGKEGIWCTGGRIRSTTNLLLRLGFCELRIELLTTTAHFFPTFISSQ
jgi:hypothetical protein